MAILDNLPGVKVHVAVDGKDLREYNEPEIADEDDFAARYIEVVSDENFAIRYKVPRNFDFAGSCLSFRVSLDGSELFTPFVGYGNVAKRSFRSERDCVHLKGRKVRKLKFNELTIVSDVSTGLQGPLDEMGTIKVEVFHRNVVKESKNARMDDKDISGSNTISEKSIKGQSISHRASLGSVEKSTLEPPPRWTTKPVKEPEFPAGTFVFKYRSRDALKGLMILPRSPSPPPPPPPLEERPEEDLSHEEAVELVRQLKAKQTSQVKIKKEKNEGDFKIAGDEVCIKEEIKEEPIDEDSNPRPRKRTRPSSTPVLLEIDDDGNFTESILAVPEKYHEVVELD